ncbi:MAG: [CysO sulfur-carrier protein]-S-L-cysteine hydrolase [Solirubrobacterales bacterium]|jgi:proteasome lid subunit RPN8/RPN11|nr:[CysO sulfur-carrier protein]-S-L-cysteine hydrolase [Solirubrobacterales bacterium]
MKISQALIDEMVAHAREDLPNECCGLIGGRDGVATTVYPMRNEYESPLRYKLHSGDSLRVNKEMDEVDEEIVGVYHSHTKTAAYPSQTDVNEGQGWPQLVYFIVSLADADSPDVKAFLLEDLKIADVELDVT